MKRYIRPTSNEFVNFGSKSVIKQDFAVVPPMSKHIKRDSFIRRANQLPANAPAAGPLSTKRIGARAASSALTTLRWKASSAQVHRSLHLQATFEALADMVR